MPGNNNVITLKSYLFEAFLFSGKVYCFSLYYYFLFL